MHNPTRLGLRSSVPYTIERVHVNGNLTILLRPGISERINIRRVMPYCLYLNFKLLKLSTEGPIGCHTEQRAVLTFDYLTVITF